MILVWDCCLPVYANPYAVLQLWNLYSDLDLRYLVTPNTVLSCPHQIYRDLILDSSICTRVGLLQLCRDATVQKIQLIIVLHN